MDTINKIFLKYIKQKLLNIGYNNEFPIIVGDFNSPLLFSVRSNRQKD